MRVAIIGYGEVGGIFARDLRSHGVAMAASDTAPGAQVRAQAEGVTAPGAAVFLDGVAVAFVCVTAGSALDAMRSLRGALAQPPPQHFGPARWIGWKRHRRTCCRSYAA